MTISKLVEPESGFEKSCTENEENFEKNSRHYLAIFVVFKGEEESLGAS